MLTIELQTKDKSPSVSKNSVAINEQNIGPLTIKHETLPQSKGNGQQNVRLKSIPREIVIGFIISLSAVMFGYSLKEITSVPISLIIKEYDITVGKFAAQSILIGILPFGAILGVVITKFLITRYRRLTGIYIFTIVNVGAMVLVNITYFGTLITGRFIEGICVGYYTTIAPIYLKEIAPKELRRMLGLFFSFGKIIGVLFVIMLELIFDKCPFDYGWRIILSMTGVFSILQAVLIYFFGSDTPAEMIQKGKEHEAMKIIEQYYKDQYVKEVFDEYKKELEMEVAKGIQTHSENLNETKEKMVYKKSIKGIQTTETMEMIQSEPNVFTSLKFPKVIQSIGQGIQMKQKREEQKAEATLTFEAKKTKAYLIGIHLCVIRHWTGGNAIITQGGLFINSLNPELGHYTSLLINAVQFVFVVIGLVYIQKIAGKRPLFLISITCMSLLNIALAISMMNDMVLPSEMIMCIFMAVYGGSFISPIWSYPSEIIPASQALVPNIVHWLALAISTLVPPVITGVMPGNNAYPVFLFFGLYGFLGLIHVFTTMKESDGKSYNEIIKSFK